MQIGKPEELLKLKLFKIEKLMVASRPFYRLAVPDWVNTVPVTTQGEVLLIRQFRIGIEGTTLETPGGVVDDGEKDMTMAAVRELEEETGYTSRNVLPLAALNPNPAIMTNTVHFFLALNCAPAKPRQHFPDDGEIDLQTEHVAIADLDMLVRSGRINHCLSALGIMLAKKYLQDIQSGV